MSVQRSSNSAELKARLQALSTKQVEVGFFETDNYPDGTPVAYVAAINEFGNPAGNLPARPFFRPATTGNADDIKRRGAAAVAAVARGADIDTAMGALGETVVADVQDTIIATTTPPLAASTIYNRQHRKDRQRNMNDAPLRDTGQMLQSVRSQVTDK